MTRFVDQQEFHALARARRAAGTGIMRPAATVLRAGDGASRVVRYTLSDGSVDRAGDRIDPNGWDITDFIRNPVVLFAHDATAPPVGRLRNVHPDGMRLVGDVEFAAADIYPFADTIYRMVRGDFMRAGSVGFLPGTYKFSDDKSRQGGIDFLEGHQLLEFSIVPVPCNANALQEARAKGIDTRPLMAWARRVVGDRSGIELETPHALDQIPCDLALQALVRARITTAELDLAYPAIFATREGCLAWVRARSAVHEAEISGEDELGELLARARAAVGDE